MDSRERTIEYRKQVRIGAKHTPESSKVALQGGIFELGNRGVQGL